MQHIILTKLAVGKPSEKWLVERLYLFEHFCAPSIAAQTKKDFRWILAISPATPGWFLGRALSVAPGAAFVCHTLLAPPWGSLIRPFVSDRKPIITTRLDSDDVIHRRFVELVQAAASECTSDQVIDFPVGLRLRLPDYVYERTIEQRPTHFISLVEKNGVKKTVYGFYHNQARGHYPIRIASTDPCWVEVCHGSNIVNSFKPSGQSRVTSHRGLLDYMLAG